MHAANPWRLVTTLSDRFEERGMYVPGRDTADIQPWREFGWLLLGWLLGLALFVLIFAFAT